eukprot:1916311-Amphidinium_carterae.1
MPREEASDCTLLLSTVLLSFLVVELRLCHGPEIYVLRLVHVEGSTLKWLNRSSEGWIIDGNWFRAHNVSFNHSDTLR